MHAFRVLEWNGVREMVAAHTETAIGREAALDLRPAFDGPTVERLLTLTAEAHEALSHAGVPSLGGARDVRRSIKRAQKGGVLGGVELYEIGAALSAMRAMRTYLENKAEAYPLLHAHHDALPDEKDLERLLLDALESDGTLRDDASPTLATLRARAKMAQGRILERVQAYLGNQRYRDLLSDPIYTVRDGRYVIPLKSEHRGKIPGIIHDTSSTGATVFLEPADVIEASNGLREIQANVREEEHRLLTKFSALAGKPADRVVCGVEVAAALDGHFAKARLAFDMRAVRPEPLDGEEPGIRFIRGRHPLLDPEIVVPLDLEVRASCSVLITGPNTGGKTVAIKCLGLFVLMAQAGLFLPALEARLRPFTQIFADIGDEQSLEQSLSTFSGHIKNISEALRLLRAGGLVLLDEIGAGTDPAEGSALAIAILKDMDARGAAVLASTHYGELKAFAFEHPAFTNAAMEFDPKTLRPTYRVLMGAAGASQALRIAERYGIPKEIVDRARQGVDAHAADLAGMLENLEAAQRRARQAQSDADKRAADLKKAEERAARKLAEADEIRATVHARAQDVIDAALREVRLEADAIFDQIRKSKTDPRGTEEARDRLRALDAAGRTLSAEFRPDRMKRPEPAPAAGTRVKRGDRVRAEGFSQVGVVLDDPTGKTVSVQMGQVRMQMAVAALRPAEPAPGDRRSPTGPRPENLRLARAMSQSTEINLIQKRAEDAERELEKFLDDAVLAGLDGARIVHGKGEGILREVVRRTLRAHKGVSDFREAEGAEGGAGVTVATFA